MWQWLPSVDANLEEAWTGPFEVLERKNSVIYNIKLADGTANERSVHIHVLKSCIEREAAIMRLVVVGELGEIECGSRIKLKERHDDFCEADANKLKEEFADVLEMSLGIRSLQLCI